MNLDTFSMYRTLTLSIDDFKALQLLRYIILEKAKRESPIDMTRKIGEFYICGSPDKGLGHDYCFITESVKAERRRGFCQRHKLLSKGEAVPKDPNGLLDRYVQKYAEEWSENGVINDKQVKRVRSKLVREQRAISRPSLADNDITREKIRNDVKEINQGTYEDVYVSTIPRGSNLRLPLA